MIQNFADYINEGKQVGIIYHFTSLTKFKSILNSDCLLGSQMNQYDKNDENFYISFTRNKNLFKQKHLGIDGNLVKITLDGDKLSNTFKFSPFNALHSQKMYRIEAEERLNLKNKYKLSNLDKYVIKYEIIPYEYLKYNNSI
jgi:hypothetical protein